MKEPCLSPGIIAEVRIGVKSSSAPAPSSAQPTDLLGTTSEPLTWLDVAYFRQRLRGLQKDQALEVLALLHRSLDAPSNLGCAK